MKLSKKFSKEALPAAGEKVRIKASGGIFEGIVMPRTEFSDENYVVIKLGSGYNIGINTGEILDIERLGVVFSDAAGTSAGDAKKEKIKSPEGVRDSSGKKISVIGTGGTIASRVDYITGGVHSAFSTDELIGAVPEIADIADIHGVQVFNKFSENMNPGDWVIIARNVYEQIRQGAEGVVIMHGTDTMGYTSAALSFMLSADVPVVLTGAQRSSDRGSSDAAQNLINAVTAASSLDMGGVFVVMHGESSDSFGLIHPGTKVRKMHSSRRDAFKTVNDLPVGKVYGGKVEFFENSNSYKFLKERKTGELKIDGKLEEKVALVKYFPGMSCDIIDNLINLNYRGIVIEGTGLGHVNENLIDILKVAVDRSVAVFMSSQTLYGRVNMRVYSTGRKLLKAKVVPCEDMLSETALVKLMWVLGHTQEIEKVNEMMLTNYAGEFSERTIIE